MESPDTCNNVPVIYPRRADEGRSFEKERGEGQN